MKGILIDWDFAALSGAEILFSTAKKFFAGLDRIEFNEIAEAKYLAGRDLLAGLTDYFGMLKTKKTALKATSDLTAAFAQQVTNELPSSVTPAVKNFLRTLVEQDLVLVLLTRGDETQLASALKGLGGERIVCRHLTSTVYGGLTAEMWLAAAKAMKLSRSGTLAVAGSGSGIKAALRLGIGSVAVVPPRYAYQDYTGAEEFLLQLDGPSAKRILSIIGS